MTDGPSAAPLIVVVAVLGLLGVALAAFVGVVPSLGVFDQGSGEGGALPGLNRIVDAPSADPQVRLSATAGSAGGTIGVSGSGFRPDETVVVRIDTDEVARTPADDTGGFSGVEITIPEQVRALAPERLLVTVTGERSVRSASAPFLVSR